jgi:hypothetical protein
MFSLRRSGLSGIDFQAEMAASLKRRSVETARVLREARAQAIRTSLRPGPTRLEVEECAASLYPRLAPELLAEAVELVCERNGSR